MEVVAAGTSTSAVRIINECCCIAVLTVMMWLAAREQTHPQHGGDPEHWTKTADDDQLNQAQPLRPQVQAEVASQPVPFSIPSDEHTAIEEQRLERLPKHEVNDAHRAFSIQGVKGCCRSLSTVQIDDERLI